MKSPSFSERPVRRVGPGRQSGDLDPVVVEEPLEIRVHGDTVAITMRTPGNDRELAAGFLFAEGVIASSDDIGSVRHCGRPGDEGFGNTLEFTPASGVSFDPDRLQLSRRGTLTSSACGVCGRTSIEDLVKAAGRLPPHAFTVPAAVIATAPERLREAQAAFTATGGSHAAALLDRDGILLAVHEDVGRHNAVDKVIGTLVLRGQLRRSVASETKGPALLVVSGRTSFEIIQKAAMARIPIVASVSAPSTLAVDLAARVGLTLAGFVRGGGFNLYTCPERVL
ncbi:MAG: formate dehydrogenase accessory sulfurtransferase FdhD [Myxococcota bacterium]|nr:formate dehydrogenase accessory sulfurtransferase FdhD [Myxococcota bacterium]